MATPNKWTGAQAAKLLRIIEESGADRDQVQRIMQPLAILCRADLRLFSELQLMNICGEQLFRPHALQALGYAVWELEGECRLDDLRNILRSLKLRLAEEKELRAFACTDVGKILSKSEVFGDRFFLRGGSIDPWYPTYDTGLKRNSFILVMKT